MTIYVQVVAFSVALWPPCPWFWPHLSSSCFSNPCALYFPPFFMCYIFRKGSAPSRSMPLFPPIEIRMEETFPFYLFLSSSLLIKRKLDFSPLLLYWLSLVLPLPFTNELFIIHRTHHKRSVCHACAWWHFFVCALWPSVSSFASQFTVREWVREDERRFLFILSHALER